MFQRVHLKCRNGVYPASRITRHLVHDEQVDWDVRVNDYAPPSYDAPGLHGKPWADPDTASTGFEPKWNELDGNVNRVSHEGAYGVVDGRPRNPRGRTGLLGRGLLGRWGPNHAADPIVTRWKRSESGKIHDAKTNLPILQFCAVQRRDCNEWAIPGGMVDPGEKVSATLRREFMEEAMNSLESSEDAKWETSTQLKEFFKSGREIYRGYVDDPRNTDNAWMETIAYNFHDETGSKVGKFALVAGDDAKNVRWMDASKDLPLYASHSELLHTVATTLNGHW